MYTKKYLETAMLSLLKKKPIQKIRVNEIIREIGTCKGTFYKYYRDKYELLLKCFQTNFYESICSVSTNWESFMYNFLDFAEKNSVLVLNAYDTTDINSIRYYHETLIADYILNELKESNKNFDMTNKLAVEICAANYTNLMLKWLESGVKETKESIIESMRDTMPHSLYPYLYGYNE